MIQKDGKMIQKDRNLDKKDGNRWNKKKKRGPNRQTVTLGGLKKIEKSRKRKEKQRLRRKLGELGVPNGRKQVKQRRQQEK